MRSTVELVWRHDDDDATAESGSLESAPLAQQPELEDEVQWFNEMPESPTRAALAQTA